MKRIGYLLESIAFIGNLYLAWCKAKKAKSAKPAVIEFGNRLDENIKQIRQGILNNSIMVGDYNYFTIHDPKTRVICAAAFTERVLHHAIMNICHPVFERHMIFDTYATRRGKGTYAAIYRAKYFLQKYRWHAKLDVRKYFDSIDHTILMTQLNKLFKDQHLLDLFSRIIRSYSTDEGKGLPIGNLTSQYFANHYLSAADHMACRQLKVPGYIRYMDDMVIFENDLKSLKAKQINFGHRNSGLPYLGYVIFPNYILLNHRSKTRFKAKLVNCLKQLEEGNWSEKKFQEHTLPLFAFLNHAHTMNLRKSLILNPNG